MTNHCEPGGSRLTVWRPVLVGVFRGTTETENRKHVEIKKKGNFFRLFKRKKKKNHSSTKVHLSFVPVIVVFCRNWFVEDPLYLVCFDLLPCVILRFVSDFLFSRGPSPCPPSSCRGRRQTKCFVFHASELLFRICSRPVFHIHLLR